MDLEKNLRQLLKGRRGWMFRRGWRCPDESTLAAYVDGGLSSSSRGRVESHLADCDFCLHQVVFLQTQTVEGSLPEVSGPLMARAKEIMRPRQSISPAAPWRWATLLAATASLALLIVVQDHTVQPPPFGPAHPTIPPAVAPPPTLQGNSVPTPSGSNTVRSGGERMEPPRLLFPSENVTLGRDQLQFRWKGTPRSLFYEVRVTTADGSLIWGSRTEQLQIRIPDQIQIAPGQRCFVWIVAYLPEGKTLQSRAVAFRLAK